MRQRCSPNCHTLTDVFGRKSAAIGFRVHISDMKGFEFRQCLDLRWNNKIRENLYSDILIGACFVYCKVKKSDDI